MVRNSELIQMGFKGELLENEPLSLHTSLKVGGPADILAIPSDIPDLQNLIRMLDMQHTPRFIIGGGYNLLVRDGGFRGVVISLEKINHLEVRQGGIIHAEAGVRNRDFSHLARTNGLRGVEFLVGIPGTIGGAITMNAGAQFGEIIDYLVSLEILGDNGIQIYDKKTLNYGYRYLQLDPNKIIITANFQLGAGNPETISTVMDTYLQKRRETQQVNFPNAGSFFRNPAGVAAWKLIDEAGLRGMTIGGAQVSEVHSNFLVNLGGAKAFDFLTLAAFIKEKVFDTSGIQLQEEVHIMGED